MRASELEPDLVLGGACGVFCGSCGVYLATREDPERLAALAARFGVRSEDMRCLGCRSGTRSPHCRTCAFLPCAAERGIESCAACGEFPCSRLREFQAERPHRAELFQGLALWKEKGWEAWFRRMAERTSCAACGSLNSVYDRACAACGAEPSSPFRGEHEDAFAAPAKPPRS